MDQKKAIKLSREGLDLYKENKFEESLEKYIEAAKLADMNHYATPEIFSEYGMVLIKLGRVKEAITPRFKSLECALNTDDKESSSVIIYAYFLIDYLLETGDLEEAQNLLNEYINLDCESKYLIYFVAAKFYYKKNINKRYLEFLDKAFHSSPKRKWKCIDDVKALIEKNNFDK